MIKFSLKNGTAIPSLGFGTYRLSGKACTEMVARAIEVGYRHIDTAQAYDNQTAIAPALKGISRKELYLVSKLWLGDHTKKRVPKAAETILKELNTEYLDLLLIHWPDRTVPIGETLEAMAQLVEEGKVKSLGVSNFTTGHIKDVFETGIPIVVNQIECHPYFYQDELIEFCQEHQIMTTAWSPLAKGKVYKEPILQKIGAKHGKTAGQIALRWLVQKGNIAIPKTAHLDHAKENIMIFDFSLTNEEIEAIDGLSKGKRFFNPTFSDFDYL